MPVRYAYIGIRALSCELNVSASAMKLAFIEDRCYSYKRRRGQLLAEKACDKGEETS